MKRRLFISGVFGLSIMGATLTGCGGSSDKSGRGPNLASTRATVQLPGGFSLPMSDLRGATAWSEEGIKSDGSFGARTLAPATPALAWLRHSASGRTVLWGFVGEGQSGVSTLGTAQALLALSLGMGALPGASRREALALLAQHPATVMLAEVVERRVTANPFALTDGDAELKTALKNAFDTLAAGTRAAKEKGSVTRQANELAPTLTVIPDTPQSLAQVTKGGVGTSIQSVNRGRRPATSYTYRIGEENKQGARTDYPTAARIGDVQELRAVASIASAVVSLGERPPWVPESAPAVNLTAAPDAGKTFYETVILMASGKTPEEGEPGFFSLSRYAGEVENWRKKREELNVHAWIGGVLYDLIATLIGGAGTALSASGVAASVAELEAIGAAAVQQALQQAARGSFTQATIGVMEKALASDLLSSRVSGALARIVLQSEAAGATAIAEGGVLTAIAGLAELVLTVLLAAGTLLALVDLGVTYSDVLTSEKAARWESVLTRASIRISPEAANLGRGREITLNAAVAEAAGRIVYAWRLDGGGGLASLRDTSGNTGATFETESSQVTLASTPSTQGTITITVAAFAVDEGGVRRAIGEAKSQITLGDIEDPSLVHEIVRHGSLAGAIAFYYTFPIQPSARTYTLTFRNLQSGDERVYEIRRNEIGASAPPDLDLSNFDLPGGNVIVRYVSGSDRFPFPAYRRDDMIYYPAITTGYGPDGKYGNTIDEVVANISAEFRRTVQFTVTTTM